MGTDRSNRSDANSDIGTDDTFTAISMTAFSGTASELRPEQISGNTNVLSGIDADMAADFQAGPDRIITFTGGVFVCKRREAPFD